MILMSKSISITFSTCPLQISQLTPQFFAILTIFAIELIALQGHYCCQAENFSKGSNISAVVSAFRPESFELTLSKHPFTTSSSSPLCAAQVAEDMIYPVIKLFHSEQVVLNLPSNFNVKRKDQGASDPRRACAPESRTLFKCIITRHVLNKPS
jgi:hypothetical protein